MPVSISPVPRKQYLDANGNPLVGGKLFYYSAGSSTKQNTYTDSAGTTPNSNPIILDSQGRTPYEVWFTDGLSYKEVLAPSTDTDPPTSGVTMGDNLLGTGAATSTQSEWVLQAFTPTYISASSFSVAGDQTTAFHVGRRIKCSVTAGTVYGFIKSSVYTSLTTVTVQVDSTAIDSGITEVSLGILSANNPSIPNSERVFNAKNLLLNSRFAIAQAGTSFVSPATNIYDLDGWFQGNASAAVMTITQDTGSVPVTGYFARKVVFTTADAAIAAGDLVTQQTKIEGYNCVDLIDNTFTIGFWVRSAVTGIHCVTVYNGTSTYVSEYTIDSANTWEYKTITIVGGTPVIASSINAAGLTLEWCNLVGATGQTTAGSWQAGRYRGTANQVNDAATINNTFYLSGVTLNLGETVTNNGYDHDTELSRCQRHYQYVSNYQRRTYGAAGGISSETFQFHPMMAAPTATLGSVTNSNSTGGSASNVTANSVCISFTVTALGSSSITNCTLELASRL